VGLFQEVKSKEKEVVTIMMSLFDEEQIMKIYVKDMQNEAAQEAAKKNAKENAKKMFEIGMSFDNVAKCVTLLSFDELREIEEEVMALA
jgi:nitrous oxide reductase accessory protein NosL